MEMGVEGLRSLLLALWSLPPLPSLFLPSLPLPSPSLPSLPLLHAVPYNTTLLLGSWGLRNCPAVLFTLLCETRSLTGLELTNQVG